MELSWFMAEKYGLDFDLKGQRQTRSLYPHFHFAP